MSLKELGTDYVDLLLIHNPLCGPYEFKSSFTPHFFEWGNTNGKWFVEKPIQPYQTIDGDDVRELVTEARLKRQEKAGINYEQIFEIRAKSWEALEKAHKEGKARMIGVSNYPGNVLEEMTKYASIHPAVN